MATPTLLSPRRLRRGAAHIEPLPSHLTYPYPLEFPSALPPLLVPKPPPCMRNDEPTSMPSPQAPSANYESPPSPQLKQNPIAAPFRSPPSQLSRGISAPSIPLEATGRAAPAMAPEAARMGKGGKAARPPLPSLLPSFG
ncbi:hypothetical protein PVAP13_2KG262716 [Panicum virgatum]|uniref:Uncharacterized protein n=1 Tax=Panicum virgatum TaxID=38727 RepID=A0A8T0W435_PANVG|nr:hypothetical protein PVAP13_2KG262716 [Panicum virgatum]